MADTFCNTCGCTKREAYDVDGEEFVRPCSNPDCPF
jgi:hypothetical protein